MISRKLWLQYLLAIVVKMCNKIFHEKFCVKIFISFPATIRVICLPHTQMIVDIFLQHKITRPFVSRLTFNGIHCRFRSMLMNRHFCLFDFYISIGKEIFSVHRSKIFKQWLNMRQTLLSICQNSVLDFWSYMTKAEILNTESFKLRAIWWCTFQLPLDAQ